MTDQSRNWMSKWPLLCGLLAVMFVTPARSALDFYGNDTAHDYFVPYTPPPTIDATNFENSSRFSVTFTTFGLYPETYETRDTLTYTNTGVMIANSSSSTNNSNVILDFSLGCGFLFDNYSPASGFHSPASMFYNPGTVRANSFLDLGQFFLFVDSVGKCTVNATNIVNPGTIELGFNGLIQLTGQNVDLSRGNLSVENFDTFLFNLFGFFTADNSLSGIDFGVGTDTNADWIPSIDLQPTFAVSSLFNSQSAFFNQMVVNPSVPYFHEDDTTDPTTGLLTHRLVRAVFLNANPGTNVVANVYFGANSSPPLGPGFVTVEWVGSYIDPATGTPQANYLYLKDFYLRGANTNNPIFNGIPSNFTFTELTTPALFDLPASASAFPAITPFGVVVTNNYSYVLARLTATTVATNPGVLNPSGALTNLSSRIQVDASQTLDLSLAQISGANYLSLAATNQFNGAEGAKIFSPYSDISLGVTNGFLSVSNVLEPSTPAWDGTVQAWSSDWITVDDLGVTNEYRVLLLNANLNPTTPAQVQNLTMHATNLVVSDALNVFGKVSVDAQNLTLTTNFANGGIGSPEGELDMSNPSLQWRNCFPNLKNITNNGAIGFANLVQFTNSAVITSITTNSSGGSSAVAAFGTLTEQAGTNLNVRAAVAIGTNVYTFTNKTPFAKVPNLVKLEKKFDGTLSNLIAAINHTGVAGVAYSTNTAANPVATAGPLVKGATTNFTVTAIVPGFNGNFIVTTNNTAVTNLTWGNHGSLHGGKDAVAPVITLTTNTSTVTGHYFNVINDGVFTDMGTMAWVDNFESSGVFDSGSGSFSLYSLTTTLINGSLLAGDGQLSGGDVSIATGSLVTSNLFLRANRSLTINATNLLTDSGPTNGSVWIVASNAVDIGLRTLIKPPVGDLLGTAITNYAPSGKKIINVWAGLDRGVDVSGYADNLAVGHLVLNALGTGPMTQFYFTGAATGNALYVDRLDLEGGVDYNSHLGATLPALFVTNLVIYYAAAFSDGADVSSKLDGFNGNHLRWVPAYVGHFSSTNSVLIGHHLVLAGDTTTDSDGDGIPNSSDSTPFFQQDEINLKVFATNAPTKRMVISWTTTPHATNNVLYSTNLTSWQLLTNFITPTPIPGPATNVMIFDPIVNPGRYYQVVVNPWLTYPF